MSRPKFLDNPRARWTQTSNVYQSPAEYATPIHFAGSRHGYPVAWWVIVCLCGVAGFVSMVFG